MRGLFGCVGVASLIAMVACDLDGSGSGFDDASGSSVGGDEGEEISTECQDMAWSSELEAFEDEVLALVNQVRAQGTSCGGTSMPAVPSLQSNDALRCASRLHSVDMVERDFFDHVNPDGEEPWDRFEAVGYAWSTAGENIAAGYPDAASVMEGWLTSPGHCLNIMSADFTEIGVGVYESYWTQGFARPR